MIFAVVGVPHSHARFAVVGVPYLHASQLAHQHTPSSGLMTNDESTMLDFVYLRKSLRYENVFSDLVTICLLLRAERAFTKRGMGIG